MAFLRLRRYFRLKTAMVTYIVSGGLFLESYSAARIRNIREADSVFANNNYLAQLVKEKLMSRPDDLRRDRSPLFFPAGSGADVASFRLLSFMPDRCGHTSVHHRRPASRALAPSTVSHRGNGRGGATMQGSYSRTQMSNVEFMGHLSQPQLGQEMRRADIFFFPEYR